jgi:hypothetical protein
MTNNRTQPTRHHSPHTSYLAQMCWTILKPPVSKAFAWRKHDTGFIAGIKHTVLSEDAGLAIRPTGQNVVQPPAVSVNSDREMGPARGEALT